MHLLSRTSAGSTERQRVMENLIIHFLDVEYMRRVGRNSRYSLRSYAKDLNISPSFLGDLLAGRKFLSELRAKTLAKNLRLNDHQSNLFCTSAQAFAARSPKKRALGRAALARQKANIEREFLQEEHFRLISEWYHLAILECIQLKEIVPSVANIATLLQLPVSTVEAACARLELLKLVSFKEGLLHVLTSSVATSCPQKSAAIQSFHTAMLEKATSALANISVNEREFHCMFVSLGDESTQAAVELLRKNSQKLLSELEAYGGKKRVYSLCVQLFPISQDISVLTKLSALSAKE